MPRVSSHFSLRDPRLQSLIFFQCVPVTNATDSNQTYTVAQVLGGLIIRTIGAGRTDTLPTAAAMVEAIQGCMVGTAFEFTVAPTGGTLTVAMGAGGTAGIGTMTCVTTATKTFIMLFTNVGIGTEAYVIHSLGTATV